MSTRKDGNRLCTLLWAASIRVIAHIAFGANHKYQRNRIMDLADITATDAAAPRIESEGWRTVRHSTQNGLEKAIEGASLRYCLISEMDFRVARHPGGIASTPQNHPNCCQYAAMGIDEASYKLDPGESTGGT